MKKEMNLKTIIIIVASILCIIGAILIIRLTLKPKENKTNETISGIEIIENKNILKDKKVGGLDVTNQVLYNDNNVSKFSATFKNNTKEDIDISKLYIIFKKGKVEDKVLIIQDKTIQAGDTYPANITFDKDMLNTTKIEYALED